MNRAGDKHDVYTPMCLSAMIYQALQMGMGMAKEIEIAWPSPTDFK